MEKPKNYENTVAATGDFEQIKLGGHVCKIISAKVEKTKTNKDMLIIAFDIEKGENAGFYERRHELNKQFNADAKWPGVHRIMLEDKDGNCNKFFKGFITSIEASNNGFKFDFDEKKLKNKTFGAVFGREQYETQMGELKFATKIRFIKGTNDIENANIPEDKLLNKAQNSDINGTFISVDDTDELPF